MRLELIVMNFKNGSRFLHADGKVAEMHDGTLYGTFYRTDNGGLERSSAAIPAKSLYMDGWELMDGGEPVEPEPTTPEESGDDPPEEHQEGATVADGPAAIRKERRTMNIKKVMARAKDWERFTDKEWIAERRGMYLYRVYNAGTPEETVSGVPMRLISSVLNADWTLVEPKLPEATTPKGYEDVPLVRSDSGSLVLDDGTFFQALVAPTRWPGRYCGFVHRGEWGTHIDASPVCWLSYCDDGDGWQVVAVYHVAPQFHRGPSLSNVSIAHSKAVAVRLLEENDK